MKTKTALNVGERIRLCRIKCKMTQQELADSIGVPRSRVAHHELGHSNMTLETLQAYARALEVTPDYLLGTEDNKNVFLEFLGVHWTEQEQSEIRTFLYYLLSKRGAYHG